MGILDEERLVGLAADGDIEAVGELIFRLYRPYLCGVIKRHDSSCSDDEIEERLHEFFHFVISPTNEGKYRLRSLDEGSNPRTYIARALDNHLRDMAEAEKRNPVSTGEYDNAPDMSDDEMSLERITRREAEIAVLLDTLDDCAALPARERYILLTYLLAERYSGEGKPLRLSEMLGRQLGMPPSTVYNCYSRGLKKLRKLARARLDRYTD